MLKRILDWLDVYWPALIYCGVVGVFVLLLVREDAEDEQGCRDAGGSMVGDACIIRSDCSASPGLSFSR